MSVFAKEFASSILCSRPTVPRIRPHPPRHLRRGRGRGGRRLLGLRLPRLLLSELKERGHRRLQRGRHRRGSGDGAGAPSERGVHSADAESA